MTVFTPFSNPVAGKRDLAEPPEFRTVIEMESELLETISVDAEVVRVAVLLIGGLPWLFTVVTICIVTTSAGFKSPPSVTTTV